MGGKRKSSGGGDGDGEGPANRRKRTTPTAAIPIPTGKAESPPNSDIDEPKVDDIIKVELNLESDSGQDTNQPKTFDDPSNQELASDPNIDIGEVDVKVLQYPEDQFIPEAEDVDGLDSSMINLPEPETPNIEPDLEGTVDGAPSDLNRSDCILSLSVQQKDREITRLTRELQVATGQNALLQQKVYSKSSHIQELSDKINVLEDEVLNHAAESKVLKRELEEARSESETLERKLHKKRVDLERETSRVIKLKDKQRELVQENSKLEEELNRKIPPIPHDKPKDGDNWRMDGSASTAKFTSTSAKAKTEVFRNAPISSTSQSVASTEADNTDERTVFVCNLGSSIGERAIRRLFADTGKIEKIILANDLRGRFKGYCHIRFSTSEEAKAALKKDGLRNGDDSRTLFVSMCNKATEKMDCEAGPSSHNKLKYSNNLEKNKLFLKGLPTSLRIAELQNYFQSFKGFMECRLVKNKHGESKGLAYVEFSDETSVQNAILRTDGRIIWGQRISAMVSNPGARSKFYSASAL